MIGTALFLKLPDTLFPLSEKPESLSARVLRLDFGISVDENGRIKLTGWTFEEAQSSLVFDKSVTLVNGHHRLKAVMKNGSI